MLYDIIKRMIEHKNTDGLLEKIDILYSVGNKLTKEEYIELTEMLKNN